VLSQQNISATTPRGATIVAGGVTFRAWVPRAQAVYLNPVIAADGSVQLSDAQLMSKDASGYWTAFVPGAGDGFLYRYYVVGNASSGFKRDPYARELKNDVWPNCSSIVRDASAYPWHDAGFVIPDFSALVTYQFHIGVFAISTPGVASNFLDVIGKLEYLSDLGVNMLQPLPIVEQEQGSMGYAGGDFFSPDFPYVCTDPVALPGYLATINRLLANKGQPALALTDITSGVAQLKVMVDLAHLYGMAVAFDVVYGHGGSFFGDDNALYYMDRFGTVGLNQNESLYFTDKGEGGGQAFALWNDPVSQYLLDNAAFFLNECHVDGFRYDEISEVIDAGQGSAWIFCRSLTDEVRGLKDRALQNAEFWPGEGNTPDTRAPIVASTASGGCGFDVVQHDALRNALRGLIQAASGGASTPLSITGFAPSLYPTDMDHGWRAVTCIENHDIVYLPHEGQQNAGPRIPALADPSNHRSWYARSRTRVGTALLLLAPGIPQLFMGQEFLEDKLWYEIPTSNNLIWWEGLNADPTMGWQLRCTRDLIALRKMQPALRGDPIRAFWTDDYARVLGFHRWIEGSGEDVIVVATLSETTHYGYSVGFPFGGFWREIFNSDVYDNWVNPQIAGNSGAITADGPPLHGFTTSAAITIPANGVVVFSRG
jgi:1,4-alpha-glucan branching enzyme